MGDHGGTAEPAEFAAEIAHQLDRVRMSLVRFLGSKTEEVAQRYDVPAPALMRFGMLRNTLPDRLVTVDDIVEVFIYSPGDEVRAAIDQLVLSGALESGRGHAVVVTNKGRDIIHRLFALTQGHIDALWVDHADLVATLFPLADRACAAVGETGGATVRVVAPPYDPPSASLALRLAERLTPLRFHRFDAHVEAWRAEGLNVEQVQALEPGPLMDKIEAATNRWAAAPYCVLSPDERQQLLRGLESLPG